MISEDRFLISEDRFMISEELRVLKHNILDSKRVLSVEIRGS